MKIEKRAGRNFISIDFQVTKTHVGASSTEVVTE